MYIYTYVKMPIVIDYSLYIDQYIYHDCFS